MLKIVKSSVFEPRPRESPQRVAIPSDDQTPAPAPWKPKLTYIAAYAEALRKLYLTLALRHLALCQLALCHLALCNLALCHLALCELALCHLALCNLALCNLALCNLALCNLALCNLALRNLARKLGSM